MVSKDTFDGFAGGVEGPADNFAAITKSDSVDLAIMTRAVYVGTGGDVVALDRDGTVVTFKNVPSGSILPIRATRINSTNTTAADLVGMW